MDRAIEINGTKYPLKFGIGAYRLLGRVWKLDGVQGVMNKIQSPFEEGKEAGSFEQFDVIGYLTWAAISNAGVEEGPDVDAIIDDMMFAPEKMEAVMTAFSENIPQQKPGNPQPRKKPGKKGAKKS